MELNYPLAKDGVFWSIQGEGHLRGQQMVFVRLGGCSVGCPQCDTDYGVAERQPAHVIAGRVWQQFSRVGAVGVREPWVWVTGGEPADHDLRPLLKEFTKFGWNVAVATSGKSRVIPPVDWLSVSYHGGYPLRQVYGNELKIIDGLNGMSLEDFAKEYPDSKTDFMFRYVQPMSVKGAEDAESLGRCKAFLAERPSWCLSRQDHLAWEVK